MEFNDELMKISDNYNRSIEGMLPRSIPPAAELMKKRESRESLYLSAGRLGMAYTFLIIAFVFASILLINSISRDKLLSSDSTLNTGIFSVDHPGSLVSAFREVTE